MPQAPDYIPKNQRKKWTALWKNAMDQYGDEGRAYAVANSIVKPKKNPDKKSRTKWLAAARSAIVQSVMKAYARATNARDDEEGSLTEAIAETYALRLARAQAAQDDAAAREVRDHITSNYGASAWKQIGQLAVSPKIQNLVGNRQRRMR